MIWFLLVGGKVVDHIYTLITNSSIESCCESLLRSSKKEGLQGEVNDMTNAPDSTPLGVEIDPLYVRQDPTS